VNELLADYSIIEIDEDVAWRRITKPVIRGD
jgi:hypothetical protein